jgi:ElaB/YqjD/DUF883 family membrane-anchored ribosome-binding protein
MTEFHLPRDVVNRNEDHAITGAHRTMDHLLDAASGVAEKLEATGQQLKEAESRVSESCRHFVQAKPWTSLGIALASGLVLGWALRLR